MEKVENTQDRTTLQKHEIFSFTVSAGIASCFSSLFSLELSLSPSSWVDIPPMTVLKKFR
jgi:hypothetical protein